MLTSLTENKNKRYRLKISGRVQGVGFRPTVYRYAVEKELRGWVFNSSQGVVIEVEGEERRINEFLKLLKEKPPPQAEILDIQISPCPLVGEKEFKILSSATEEEIKTQVSPDLATCQECLRELNSFKDRRYHYPFINCTNCGPRYTILKRIPYDRKNTTMSVFKMCKECFLEYTAPLNRRFHAQPNACWECGPEVEMINLASQKKLKGEEAIKEARQLLAQGEIVALKGLGGFHLACDATQEKAVRNLRQRKFREDKPFALMAKALETIKLFCEVSPSEEALLISSKAPIVLLKKKHSCSKIAEEVAPHNPYLGFMLPYTPLHHLLFKGAPFEILVMTSGNISDEPIAYQNSEAKERLQRITPYLLVHNRAIYIRCDDSVTRILPFTQREMLIRRARGYVPQPLSLPFKFHQEILAVGAHLKNTFCFGKDNFAFISHHIGDLENAAALESFTSGIEHFKNIFKLNPSVIAYDLHPEYLSTKYAQAQKDTSFLIPIQHHHAHIASCLADNQVKNKEVIGVAFDGVGLGEDNTLWGGEFLIASYQKFTRIGYLKPIPLPGGEQAIKEPWRVAGVYLEEVYGEKFLELNLEFVSILDKKKWRVLQKMLSQKINSPLTSSIGRLFDAVAALLGVRQTINYEGQAAIELELLADDEVTLSYPYEIKFTEGQYIIDPKGIIEGIVTDLLHCVATREISAKFHQTVVEIIVKMCSYLRRETQLQEVALSGGVFQNMFLLERTFEKLTQAGFKIYLHSKVPPNDGGISLGQAVIANEKVKGEKKCA